MPTWGEILAEMQAAADPNGVVNTDHFRQRFLNELSDLTGRNVILYATDWMNVGGPATSITIQDMQGLMEVCKDLPGPNLDLVLHSPGGSPEDTAAIVRYLRQKYDHIRAFVPLAAMSAATMWSLSCDEIVMGKHSQLGPIDPQLVSAQGQFPARAIIEQFERAKRECAENPAVLGAWAPILQQYGPSLLEQCEKAEELAHRLVREWVAAYMLKDEPDREDKAEHIAAWFANPGIHQSHRLGIGREEAAAQGVKITHLEDDQDLQDAVLSVHHVAMHTLQGTPVKIIENQKNKRFIQHQQQSPIQFPIQAPAQAIAQGKSVDLT